jgi:hypothetical protein
MEAGEQNPPKTGQTNRGEIATSALAFVLWLGSDLLSPVFFLNLI